MSIIAAALQNALIAGSRVLAENDGEFDPDSVSPGAPGFIMTGIFALAVIALGFLLVRKLRRNAYRHEVRDAIAVELAEREENVGGSGGSGAADGPDAPDAPGTDGRATPPTS